MKNEDTYYDRLKKRGSGLPMDDLKKHLKEHQEKLKQEELKATTKKKETKKTK